MKLLLQHRHAVLQSIGAITLADYGRAHAVPQPLLQGFPEPPRHTPAIHAGAHCPTIDVLFLCFVGGNDRFHRFHQSLLLVQHVPLLYTAPGFPGGTTCTA